MYIKGYKRKKEKDKRGKRRKVKIEGDFG